ncbi:MAG: hypothetical protein ACXACU_03915 [Candidatus Hodarchaeales archaeon]
MAQEGSNVLHLPVNKDNGWNEELIKQVESLILKLHPTEVIKELEKLTSSSLSPKKSVGRPKSYRTAWVKLENGLIDLEEFQTLVHLMLVNKEISTHAYYRAIKKANNFIERRKIFIEPKTYKEAWVLLQAKQISIDQFEAILNNLLISSEINQTVYDDGLAKAKKYEKFRQISVNRPEDEDI